MRLQQLYFFFFSFFFLPHFPPWTSSDCKRSPTEASPPPPPSSFLFFFEFWSRDAECHAAAAAHSLRHWDSFMTLPGTMVALLTAPREPCHSRLSSSSTFNEAVTQGGFRLLEKEKEQRRIFQAFPIPLMRSLSNLKLLLVT